MSGQSRISNLSDFGFFGFLLTPELVRTNRNHVQRSFSVCTYKDRVHPLFPRLFCPLDLYGQSAVAVCTDTRKLQPFQYAERKLKILLASALACARFAA